MLISDAQFLARVELLIEIGNNSTMSYTNNYFHAAAASYLVTHGFITNDEEYLTIVKCHKCKLTDKGKELLNNIKQLILK